MDNEALVADMLTWIDQCPRAYDEVMDAWRTSCPRLAIWEDAVDHGLVEHRLVNDNDIIYILKHTGVKNAHESKVD